MGVLYGGKVASKFRRVVSRTRRARLCLKTLPSARERAVRPLARTSKQAYPRRYVDGDGRRQRSNKPVEARYRVFRHSLTPAEKLCNRKNQHIRPESHQRYQPTIGLLVPPLASGNRSPRLLFLPYAAARKLGSSASRICLNVMSFFKTPLAPILLLGAVFGIPVFKPTVRFNAGTHPRLQSPSQLCKRYINVTNRAQIIPRMRVRNHRNRERLHAWRRVYFCPERQPTCCSPLFSSSERFDLQQSDYPRRQAKAAKCENCPHFHIDKHSFASNQHR